MATVKGIWIFKDEIKPFSGREIVNFTSGTNNESFLGFEFTGSNAPVFELAYILEITDDWTQLQDAYFYEEDPVNNIKIGW